MIYGSLKINCCLLLKGKYATFRTPVYNLEYSQQQRNCSRTTTWLTNSFTKATQNKTCTLLLLKMTRIWNNISIIIVRIFLWITSQCQRQDKSHCQGFLQNNFLSSSFYLGWQQPIVVTQRRWLTSNCDILI